jgi:EmrB/QacA subfamily drug resistance transporter
MHHWPEDALQLFCHGPPPRKTTTAAGQRCVRDGFALETAQRLQALGRWVVACGQCPKHSVQVAPELQGPGEDLGCLRGSRTAKLQQLLGFLPPEKPGVVSPEHEVVVAAEVLPLDLPIGRSRGRVREVQGEVAPHKRNGREAAWCFHRSSFYRFTSSQGRGRVTTVIGYDGNRRTASERWVALVLLCAVEFAVVGALTVVAIALPSIGDDLGFSRSGRQWVISAYVLTFGGFLLPGGRAADLWGRRRVFVVGLALFSAASLVCGATGSAALLVGARAAQGLGAGVVTPAALAILTDLFSEGRGRSRAVGFWTAAQAGGGAAGWVLGGFLAQGPGWQWIFLATVPLGALGVLLAPLLLRETRDSSSPPKVDAAGATTATAGLALLVYGLTRAEEVGLTSPSTLVAVGLAVVLVAAFVVIEARVEYPLVPLGVFRARDLVGSCLVALALQATTNAPLLLCIFYLQDVAGLPPAEAGLILVPFNVAVVGGSLSGPRLTRGLGAGLTAASGLVTIAAGVLLLVRLVPNGGYGGVLLPAFLLMGVGVGLSAVASTTAGTSAVEGEKRGMASGFLNACAEVGCALGLGLLIPLSAARTDAVVGSVTGSPEAALVEGFRWAFYAGSSLALLGALAALVLLRANRAREPQCSGAADARSQRVAPGGAT